jgi:cytochrome c oxidase cbb3-type subunit 2
MKNGSLFLTGIFIALVASWGVFVLGSNAQLGSLVPYYDDNEGNAFPLRASGLAGQGERVYMDLGCVSCHTQQVRRPGYGSDQARGWGDRQSVARDYIFQDRPQLGTLRLGPDLANLGARKPNPPDTAELMKLLYAGSRTHPAYAFLFEDRRIVGERSQVALKLEGRMAPRLGHEIVPTSRAEALVAYLLSRNQSYEFPEARPVAAAAPEKKDATK